MVQAGSTASSDNGGGSTHTGRRAPTGSSRAVDRGGVVVPVVTGPGHVAGTLAVPTDHGRLHPLTTDDEPGPSGQPQRRQEQTRARPPPRHVGRYCVLHGGKPDTRLSGLPAFRRACTNSSASPSLGAPERLCPRAEPGAV